MRTKDDTLVFILMIIRDAGNAGAVPCHGRLWSNIAPLKVLILEDEFLLAMDLEAHLEALGQDVVGVASDAAGAFDLAESEAPDLALVDINLRDGRSGPRIASGLARKHDTLVVFVTGSPDQIPSDYAGAVGAVLKP